MRSWCSYKTPWMGRWCLPETGRHQKRQACWSSLLTARMPLFLRHPALLSSNTSHGTLYLLLVGTGLLGVLCLNSLCTVGGLALDEAWLPTHIRTRDPQPPALLPSSSHHQVQGGGPRAAAAAAALLTYSGVPLCRASLQRLCTADPCLESCRTGSCAATCRLMQLPHTWRS